MCKEINKDLEKTLTIDKDFLENAKRNIKLNMGERFEVLQELVGDTTYLPAHILLENISQEYRDAYDDGDEDKFDNSYRVCSECNSIMTEGYCYDEGFAYYCSDTCLHKNHTPEEWEELYDDGNGDSYWTDWEIELHYMFRIDELKKGNKTVNDTEINHK